MTDNLKASVFALVQQSYELAKCLSQRHQLSMIGDRAGAADLVNLLRTIIDRVLRLQDSIQQASEAEGDSSFSLSIDELITGLRLVIEEADVDQLSTIARRYGLTQSDRAAEVAEMCRIAAAVDDPSPEFVDELASLAFLLIASTLASAGVASLLAVIAHEAVGPVVLSAAVSTFLTVGLTDGAVRYKDFHRRTASELRAHGIRERDAVKSLRAPSTTAGCFEIIDELRRERQIRELERNLQKLREPARQIDPLDRGLDFPPGPTISGPRLF